MMTPNYTLSDFPDGLSVVWVPPHLPESYFIPAIVLGLLALLVFYYRRFIAAHLGPALYAEWISKWITERFLFWFCLIIAGLSVVGAFMARTPKPMVQWIFDSKAITVKSLNGDMSMEWDKIMSVELDAREGISNKASLVLKDDSGKELWLIMKWLIDNHRSRIINKLQSMIPGAMKPIMSNTDYLNKINQP